MIIMPLPFFRNVLTIRRAQPISRFEIMVFLRQFATMMASGIPITECCEILEKAQRKTALRLLIYAIKRDILSGKSLFESMQRHQDHFDDFTCQLIRVGEHTGKLDTTLIHIAAHLEKNLEVTKQIKQALIYPIVITITACIVTFVMFLFVIPRFNELFHDMQDGLPLLTRCIFYLSYQLQQYIKLILLTMIAIMIIFRYKQKNIMRYYLPALALKMPVLRHCLHKIILTNFARNLALTLASGIPIIEALQIAGHVFNHRPFVSDIVKLRNKVSAGLLLHHAMAALPAFPTLMVQMIKIGEESGMLPDMLSKTAEFFEADIDHLISHFSKLLEPLIMVMLGVLIGGLVIGMYLPIFKLGSAF